MGDIPFPPNRGQWPFFLTLTSSLFNDIKNTNGMVSMTRNELFLFFNLTPRFLK